MQLYIVHTKSGVIDLYNAGLILEGGAFRGIFTAGVLDYFMENGLYLSSVIGVSAGACCGFNFGKHFERC